MAYTHGDNVSVSPVNSLSLSLYSLLSGRSARRCPKLWERLIFGPSTVWETTHSGWMGANSAVSGRRSYAPRGPSTSDPDERRPRQVTPTFPDDDDDIHDRQFSKLRYIYVALDADLRKYNDGQQRFFARPAVDGSFGARPACWPAKPKPCTHRQTWPQHRIDIH